MKKLFDIKNSILRKLKGINTIKFFIMLVCSIGFLSCSSNKIETKNFSRNDLTLTIKRNERKDDSLSITLTLHNETPHLIKLPNNYLKMTTQRNGQQELANNWFAITFENGKEALYSGYYLGYGQDKDTEHTKIKPNEKIIIELNNLERNYEVEKGSKLRIQYQGLLGESNEIEIVY